MFAPRYFAERYFAGRYFAQGNLGGGASFADIEGATAGLATATGSVAAYADIAGASAGAATATGDSGQVQPPAPPQTGSGGSGFFVRWEPPKRARVAEIGGRAMGNATARAGVYGFAVVAGTTAAASDAAAFAAAGAGLGGQATGTASAAGRAEATQNDDEIAALVMLLAA